MFAVICDSQYGDCCLFSTKNGFSIVSNIDFFLYSDVHTWSELPKLDILHILDKNSLSDSKVFFSTISKITVNSRYAPYRSKNSFLKYFVGELLKIHYAGSSSKIDFFFQNSPRECSSSSNDFLKKKIHQEIYQIFCQKVFQWLLQEFFHRFLEKFLREFSKALLQDSTRDSSYGFSKECLISFQKLFQGFLYGYFSRNLSSTTK